jgi:GNAT superfamily N-acetyltransferase
MRKALDLRPPTGAVVAGVELTWLDPDHLDARDVAAAVAVLQAARLQDSPHRPGETVSSFTGRLRHGGDGDPPVTALARDGAGRPVGFLVLSLPRWDNTHLAWLVVTVDPLWRRRGIGRQLFAAGLERARAEGRTILSGHGYDSPALTGFATAMGMEPVLAVAYRRQDLRTVDWAALDRAYVVAESHAGGYDLVCLAGPTPEEMLPAVVAMTAAINDAPTGGMDIGDAVFTPARIRAYETAVLASGRRLYRLAARSCEAGDLVGHTVVTVDRERPWLASQGDTTVLRAHRGQRLGALLKIGMLRWLVEVEPQLHTIDTSNAASNAHMIRVNDLLGYQVIATTTNYQRRL